jgi:hypothetical protein
MEGDLEDVDSFGGDAADDLIRDTETNQRGTEVNENDLESILRISGVPAKERPAPDYEPEVAEGKDEQLDEFLPALATVGSALARGVIGAGVRAKIASELDNDEETTECDSSPLQGQYGHSGKMKSVDKNADFLDRLKELSGMIRN